ncbi:MAG TPA: hypothetical protein VF657_14385 [Actinoplanes sp.]|jgi:hypothetical protein
MSGPEQGTNAAETARKEQMARNQVDRELAERASARPAVTLIRYLGNVDGRVSALVRDKSAGQSLSAWKNSRYTLASARSAAFGVTPLLAASIPSGVLFLAEDAAQLTWGIGYILAPASVDPLPDVLAVLCHMTSGEETIGLVAASRQRFASALVSHELGIDVDLDEVIRAVTDGDRREAIPPELRRALNKVVNVTLATKARTSMLALMPLLGGVVRAVTDSVVLHRVASAAEAYYRAKLRT